MFGDQPDEAVPADEYAATLRELLRRTADAGSKMILVAPFLIEPDQADPMRVMVGQYARSWQNWQASSVRLW